MHDINSPVYYAIEFVCRRKRRRIEITPKGPNCVNDWTDLGLQIFCNNIAQEMVHLSMYGFDCIDDLAISLLD